MTYSNGKGGIQFVPPLKSGDGCKRKYRGLDDRMSIRFSDSEYNLIKRIALSNNERVATMATNILIDFLNKRGKGNGKRKA